MTVINALTNYTLVRNTGTVVTPIATDADTTTLVLTPTVGTNKLILILTNTAVAAVTVNIAAGDYWAKTPMVQVSLAQNVPQAFCFEGALFQVGVAAGDDKITLIVAAAAVTTLYQVIELP